MRRIGLIVLSVLTLLPLSVLAAGGVFEPSTTVPPFPPREFRAAWIATVANIDWPSKPGLTVTEQKYELVTLLDAAVRAKFNAVLFQVRPVSDSFYSSALEPWSEYLTGVQGLPPQPFYDPLAFAVKEAHERGLAIHAWFNPFRAGHPKDRSPPAKNHITQTHPEIIRHYKQDTLTDPGEPLARTHALDVILDVVKRYDIDGVVFDDYFYPYPQKGWGGHDLDFPDDASWKKYGVHSGLSREDWRRSNVNQFVHSVSVGIKSAKPWVVFGISPFGIWRPQNPAQIKGLDAYGKLYADSRLWLADGWVDYLAPQLYWAIGQRDQSFPVLLNWWRHQNPLNRHVWPGLYDSNFEKFGPGEIARQIQTTRQQFVGGQIHYHLRSVTDTPALMREVSALYQQPALMPPSPWLDGVPPQKPALLITPAGTGIKLRWDNIGAKTARWWVLQYAGTNRIWSTEILPDTRQDRTVPLATADIVAIRSVDRLGNVSPATVFTYRRFANPPPVRTDFRPKT